MLAWRYNLSTAPPDRVPATMYPHRAREDGGAAALMVAVRDPRSASWARNAATLAGPAEAR